MAVVSSSRMTRGSGVCVQQRLRSVGGFRVVERGYEARMRSWKAARAAAESASVGAEEEKKSEGTKGEEEDFAISPAAIQVTDAARAQLTKLAEDQRSSTGETAGVSTYLRIGVKTGGCSGMSYVLDFDKEENIQRGSDSVMDIGVDALRVVVDAKSLLYLFGLTLDFSSALINGGFKFDNPNAKAACSCGKSFGT